MHRLRAFARLSRLKFLYGGFAGFALGAAVARTQGHAVDISSYLWGQALVTSFHLMVHYSNDFFDRESDARTVRTDFSGGSGALVDGSLEPGVAVVAMSVTAFLGAALIARAVVAGMHAVAVLGLATGVLSWSYSAPPFRLLGRGLGELCAVSVIAVVVPLLGYATFAHTVDAAAWIPTLPVACAMFGMMLCVEVPDVAADRATGKRNLVVRLGTARMRHVISAAPFLTLLAVVPSAARLQIAGWSGFALAVLATALLGIGAILAVGRLPFERLPHVGVSLYSATVTGLVAAYAVAG